MPKVTRTTTSFFASPTFRFIAALVVVTALSIGGAVYLGYSDKGAIDINKKISETNQDGFATRVNQMSGNNAVNGGLKPSTVPANAPTEPAPQPTPAPEATTTAATTTAASSTPLQPLKSTTTPKKK